MKEGTEGEKPAALTDMMPAALNTEVMEIGRHGGGYE